MLISQFILGSEEMKNDVITEKELYAMINRGVTRNALITIRLDKRQN